MGDVWEARCSLGVCHGNNQLKYEELQVLCAKRLRILKWLAPVFEPHE